MKNKNWLNIVQLSEFIKYFNIEELVELSLCCKLLRSKLTPDIYKTLKIDYSKIEKFGYKSHRICEVDNEYDEKHIQVELKRLIHHYKREFNYRRDEKFTYPIDFFINPYKHLAEEYIESKDKFKSDLELIPYKPSMLFINNVDNHCYLIQEFSTPFNNLKALYIQDITVTMEDLQYLLDNLERLEDLKFISSYIFKCKPKTIDSSINWPQTLKILTIGNNEEVLLENNYHPIPVHPLEGNLDISSTKHLLSPNYLHNLESLSLKPFDCDLNEEFDDKLDFLKVNPHIRKLSFPFVEATPQLFDIISSFQNLEHLNIFSILFSKPKVIENIKSSIPSNLKSVSLNLYKYMHVINFLNKSFLQIAYLTVELKPIQFNDICLFISKLPAMNLLKSLKLWFELEDDPDYNIDKPFITNVIKFPKLDNLENLVFLIDRSTCSKTDLKKLKLNIDGCRKLKCIKFKSEDNLKLFGEIGADNLELGSSWKFISTPRKYLFYKAMNQ